MTTPPAGEAGWEQRLENLTRAQEWAAIVEGPLAAQDGAGGAEMGGRVYGDGSEAPAGAEGVWVAYYSDRSAVVFFAEEIEALRHAVEHSMSVQFVHYGDRDAL